MFSAKLERWAECGLMDILRAVGGGERGPEFGTGCKVGWDLSCCFAVAPSAAWSAMTAEESGAHKIK